MLTVIFWWPLWRGGGLIGGDLYPYYFPQKQFLAQSLAEGRIPLWNNLVGLGYPVLGESQTGALYPPNLLLYRLFEMNTAYNISQLLHYVMAFAGAWGLARQLGLHSAGALLAGLAYTYGWFPARICLEWAIIGGAYLAWILWLVVRYRQSPQPQLLGGIALLLGGDLLAGHYNLAFITLMAAGVLAVVPRRWIAMDSIGEAAPAGSIVVGRFDWQGSLAVLAAVACGFLVGAVQVLPSWELKGLSQRSTAGDSFAPGYGHLPPVAITQLAAPWLWHGGDIDADQALQVARWGTIPATTNKAEAFVYAGLFPLLFTLYGWLKFPVLTIPLRRRLLLWTALGAFALLFATGWPIVWLQWAPGFSYFTGPGRYTIVTTLAVGLMGGTILDWILEGSRPHRRRLIVAGTLLFTVVDLWTASREYQFGQFPFFGRQVFYATLVDTPPIQFREQSTLRQLLATGPNSDSAESARLYAPGPNVATLTGVSAIPVYLGIGPKLYAERQMRFDFHGTPDAPADLDQIALPLREWGVTHVLLEQPLVAQHPAFRLVWQGADPLLNRAFGRLEPYYLYALTKPRGRAYFPDEEDGAVHTIHSTPERVTIEATAARPGILVVSELMYPGWRVFVDGNEAPAVAGDLRSVELAPGRHRVEWVYRPGSVYAGVAGTLVGAVIGLGLLWIRRGGEQRRQGDSS